MAEEYKTEAHQLPAGTVLHGRFEVKRVIGEGGFGITYEGLDQVLNARVAIKEYYMTGFVNRNTTVSLDVIPSVGEKAETFRKNRWISGCRGWSLWNMFMKPASSTAISARTISC